MIFWIVSVGLSVLAALTLVLALGRRGDVAEAARFDVQVYRDQLREVEKDLARGVVTEAEAEAIRTEVSRRLLEADRASGGDGASGQASHVATVAAGVGLVAVVVGGAMWLYWQIGAPGYPDLPLERRFEIAEIARETRPSQAEAEAQVPPSPPLTEPDPSFLELMDQLRAALAERPDDLQGLRLLARNEAALGNFAAARMAQSRVIAVLGETASAQDYADLADMLVLAAGGFVSPEAEAAIDAVLERDPGNGTARYYSGLLAAQTGRPDLAFRIWRALLESSRPEAPWVPPIRAQISQLARLAGVDYVLPELGDVRGPSQADIDAAGEMSAGDRMQMIENMVSGLAERLATEGGPPADWARLIRAYGVLGRRNAAAAIWAEAQTVFPDDISRVPILQAARDAGVAQ